MRIKISALAFAAGLAVGAFTATEAGFISIVPVAAHVAPATSQHSDAQAKAKSSDSQDESSDNQDESSAGSSDSSSKSNGTSTSKKTTKSSSQPKQHPCNHGYWVSKAAHDRSFKGHAHGQHVSQVAQSDTSKLTCP